MGGCGLTTLAAGSRVGWAGPVNAVLLSWISRALGFHHTAGLDTVCAYPHSFCLTILNASQLL
jgi:hypothetical protein